MDAADLAARLRAAGVERGGVVALVVAPGSGLAYSLRFPPNRTWEIESNLTPLPAKDPDEVVEKGPTAEGTEVFTARGHSKDGAFLVLVKILIGADVEGAGAAEAFGVSIDVSRSFGIFLAFLASLGTVAGAFLAFQASDQPLGGGGGSTPPQPF